MQGPPLHVWVLSDGQPGHYSLSRGIVAALARLRPVEQHWLTLRLRVGAARGPMRQLLNRLPVPPSPAWLNLFYRMPALPRTACDLIVSAGGKTSFANAWLARRMGVRNVFAGSLRRLSPALFDVVLTLEPITPQASNNLVLELPPSAFDLDEVDRSGRAFRGGRNLNGEVLWTIMLGGDGAGYRYDQDDWRQLGQLLARLAEVHGVRWLVLGSRRTGRQAEKMLSETLGDRHIAAACWYRQGDADSVAACLGAADRVFVTEDSMTMLTEAIFSQRPVVSLRPASVAPTARYNAMIERFAAKGWICRYTIAALATGQRQLDDACCTVLETSPLPGLSRELAVRLDL